MSTVTCTIEFENNTEYYRPGEVIKGTVLLNNNSKILLKALSLHFDGFACTKWQRPERLKKSGKIKLQTFIESREDYISTTNFLIGSEMANPKPFEHGNYNYNFMINIPQNIPSTFDSILGSIHYELRVEIDFGDHKDDLYKSPILIEQLKDLRFINSYTQFSIEKEQLEQKSRIKFWHHPLQLNIRVPQNAFIAGECIFVHIKVTNRDKLKINNIISNLNRIVNYKGFRKEETIETTTETETIASSSHNLYGNNSNLLEISQQIVVPKTRPTFSFDECKYISLSYELEVLVACENRKRSVKAKLPVLVGSISLKSDMKIIPTNLSNNHVSSIAVARSMEELTLPSSLDLDDNSRVMMTSGLASSLEEAPFMTAVHLNKSSRHQVLGDSSEFKPRYLYFDVSKELHHNRYAK